ncbi:hypothetical protein EON79_22580 [bacterium]|nr:MAG: hypothetical protein EON79_22580 [bacterium]
MSDLYDPQATEAEASAKSQYLGKKDLYVLGGVVLVLALLLTPIYMMGKKNSEKARCVQNFKSMFDAVNLYAKDHDDGLPPVYVVGDGGLPATNSKDEPYTWISDTAAYMTTRASFKCPAATPGEGVLVQSPTGGAPIESTYGMYMPYGGVKTFNVERADTTVLIAETSNQGANDTFDPLPFKHDGVVIGWDDNNYQSTEQSATITRLAFKGSASGDPDKALGRHDGRDERGPYTGVHALTASGELISIRPKDSKISQRADKLPGGLWNVPALRK